MGIFANLLSKFKSTPIQDMETRFQHFLDAISQLEKEMAEIKGTVSQLTTTTNPTVVTKPTTEVNTAAAKSSSTK